MSLSVWQRNIVTESGDVIPDAEIEVFDAGSSSKPDLFSDPDGNSSITNPFNADSNGFARFYVAGGRYDIAVNGAVLWEDVALGTTQRRDTGSAPSEVPTNDDANERGFAQTVNSVSDLRESTYPASLQRLWLSGYYGVGTAGGGPLYRDSESTEEDNGGTVFVDADEVRWKREVTPALTLHQVGAKGDGGDDTEALKLFFSLAGDFELYGEPGRFVFKEPIELLSNTKLTLHQDCVLDCSEFSVTDSAFYGEGSTDSDTPVSTDVQKGENVVSVNDASAYGPGDWVFLQDDTSVGSNQGSKGEIHLIESINGDDLTLRQGVWDNYETAQNAQVKRVLFRENVEISGGSIVGAGESLNQRPAINLTFYRDISIKGCTLADTHRGLMLFRSCINGAVEGCTFTGTNRDNLGYSILMEDASQWWSVRENFAYDVGKLWDCGSSPGTYGLTRFVHVDRNNIYDHGRNSGISTHEAGEYIYITNNNVNSLNSGSHGIFTRTGNTKISGNYVTNAQSNGINAQNRGRPGEIVISDNDVLDSATHGISLSQGAGDQENALDSAVVLGNRVKGAVSRGIQVTNQLAGKTMGSIVVSGNKLSEIGSEGIYLRAMDADIADAVINGNTLLDSGSNGGIVLEGQDTHLVKRCCVSANTATGNNRAIRSLGTENCFVSSNIARSLEVESIAIDGFDSAELGENLTLGP